MNATFEPDGDNLRYAEYVLGILDADARAAVAREIRDSDEAAAAVALWQRRLVPLSAEIVDESPPPHVWPAIRRRLGLDAAPGRLARWMESLALWRWIGAGATAVAAALLVVTLTRPAPPPAIGVRAGLLVSTIVAYDGKAWWTATMDTERSEALVLPGSPGPIPADRTTQLWLMPRGGRPISLGVFPPADPMRLGLDRAAASRLTTDASLAVSLEPVGGSPTGQPTGRIIAKGTLRPAG